MNRLPQDLVDKITILLDLESILVFKKVFKRNVYFATSRTFKPTTVHTWDNSAKNGWLNIIQFLHSENIHGCTVNTVDIAAEYGKLDIVKWLIEKRKEKCTNKALDMSCANRHYKTTIYLYLTFGADLEYKYYLTMNFIILLECLTVVYSAAEDHPYTDLIYDISDNVSECILALASKKSQTECYEDLDILQYVYIGAVVSSKKYSTLIEEYIIREFKLQGRDSIKVYFDYCDCIISKLRFRIPLNFSKSTVKTLDFRGVSGSRGTKLV
jgi:hypothetical protein